MAETLARAGIYEMLSRVVLTEFDSQTLTLFQSVNWQTALERLAIQVPASTCDDLERLAIDYCHIFVGPRDFCPPYQSVWETGEMQGLVVDSMKEFLQIVKPRTKLQIQDHAGMQLEMMAFILQNDHMNHECEGLAASFFERHISWIETMLQKASQCAETILYQSILEAGAEFISLEQALFLQHAD